MSETEPYTDLRLERMKRGLTMPKAARAIGISMTTLSNIERGLRLYIAKPTADKINDFYQMEFNAAGMLAAQEPRPEHEILGEQLEVLKTIAKSLEAIDVNIERLTVLIIRVARKQQV